MRASGGASYNYVILIPQGAIVAFKRCLTPSCRLDPGYFCRRKQVGRVVVWALRGSTAGCLGAPKDAATVNLPAETSNGPSEITVFGLADHASLPLDDRFRAGKGRGSFGSKLARSHHSSAQIHEEKDDDGHEHGAHIGTPAKVGLFATLLESPVPPGRERSQRWFTGGCGFLPTLYTLLRLQNSSNPLPASDAYSCPSGHPCRSEGPAPHRSSAPR